MPNQPLASAAPLANSCRTCGTEIARGDTCTACRSGASNDNAAWDRAEARIAAAEHRDMFGDDLAARDEREYYVGTVRS